MHTGRNLFEDVLINSARVFAALNKLHGAARTKRPLYIDLHFATVALTKAARKLEGWAEGRVKAYR